MRRFKKRPMSVEAYQYKQNDSENWPQWLREAYRKVPGSLGQVYYDPGYHTLNIKTLEGDMRTCPGDWIIKGVADELYPCKPDIFAATYEEVF